jgi:hypothetical protein
MAYIPQYRTTSSFIVSLASFIVDDNNDDLDSLESIKSPKEEYGDGSALEVQANSGGQKREP